jgi:hypothetical protein
MSINTNFYILTDKISETKAAISIVFDPHKSEQKIKIPDERFQELGNQFAKLYEINQKVKIEIIADTSGSMQEHIELIEEVSFIDVTFRLPKEIGCKREGAQIYTLAILGTIIKKISDNLHEINIPIQIEMEIIPFDSEVRDVLNIDIPSCSNIGDIIINHMITKCLARGSTLVEKAIEYITSKVNLLIPTIIITTTDGAFNNLTEVKTKWENLMLYPYVMGGCIAMGKSADKRGVSIMNRGECLVEGSFSTTDGCDNVIQLLPNVMSDLVKLCSLGENKKEIPLFVKLTSLNGKVYDVFGDVLYPSKSYCKIFAVIESNDGINILPTIVLTDNYGKTEEFDLNMVAPNSHIGPLLDIVVQVKNIDLHNFDKMQKIKEQIHLKIEEIQDIQYKIEIIKGFIETDSQILDTSNNSIKEIENYKNNIASIKEEIINLTVNRRSILIEFTKQIKSTLCKLKSFEKELEKIIPKCEEEESLIRMAKISIFLHTTEIKKKMEFLFGKSIEYRTTSLDVTPSAIDRTSSNIHVSQSRNLRDKTSPGNQFLNRILKSRKRKSESESESESEKEENEKKYEFSKCSICMDNDATLVAFKCGHIISCNSIECMQFFELFKKESQKCPFCRCELDPNIPFVPISVTKNKTKCQKCAKNNGLNCDLATFVLECGHLGYCNECKNDIDTKAKESGIPIKLYSCYECGVKKRILCNVFFS